MRSWLPIDLVLPIAPTRVGRLAAIFRNMMVVLGLRPAVLGVLLEEVGGYLVRAQRRLVALITRLEDGTWREPAPRTSRAGVARADEATRKPRVRLPGRKAWLNNLVGPELRLFAVQLEQLVNEPETAALLARAPKQAARILRPLGRMLYLEFDVVPPAPRRVRKPVVRAPRMTAAEHRDVLRYQNAEGRPMELYPGARRRRAG